MGVGGGAQKHEIYAAAFGGHLFYELFLQGRGRAHGPLGPPSLDPLLSMLNTHEDLYNCWQTIKLIVATTTWILRVLYSW